MLNKLVEPRDTRPPLPRAALRYRGVALELILPNWMGDPPPVEILMVEDPFRLVDLRSDFMVGRPMCTVAR
jgi:hypothetical protein